MVSIKILNSLHASLLTGFPYDYADVKQLPIIDLVTTMGAIYYKDVISTSRKKLNIVIPVFEPLKWNSISKEINQLANWVSGEQFNISFIQNKNLEFNNSLENFSLPLPNNHSVTLFSGGLDSLTGAFRNYKDSIKSDYLGFLNKSEEATYQKNLQKFYLETFSTEVMLIPKPVPKKNHLVQSTRSLLYLALAIAKAYYNESNDVYLYENGVLSLNPEINNRFTTKTTHPKTIYLYKDILRKIDINIVINHPFIFSTKGEKINAMNEEFKKQISSTFTCGSGRLKRQDVVHTGQCGVCIPCLLRKISIAAFENEKYDTTYFFNYGIKFDDIEQSSYKFEYESNINYFENYYNLIRNEKLYIETRLSERYYEENDYIEKNNIMFIKFANEFERYMEKYDPN
ncbi:hypothetical protein ACVNNN_11180 [Lysinibacillus fusiformis]|jgi:7-cyano-7-deazaguanine synthase in queuosine biosynthesis|uniref:hypothetical protein n=1 Tax=Lysinibacillus sp. PWR01 TaxID=3342384 RepID=UPI00372D5381